VTGFDDHRAAWQQYTASPWGRIRYAVVAETLRRSVRGLDPADGGAGLRVLDAGGGDGLDALPLAAAGHRVTVLDSAPDPLDDARANAARAGVPLECVEAGLDDLPAVLTGLGGPFDVVLCHFVLPYREDPLGALPLLAGAVRPGGLLSLTAPNAASEPIVRAVRLLDVEGALAALDATEQHSHTFATTARFVDAEDVTQALVRNGFGDVRRFGIRSVVDLVTDEERKADPGFLAGLERLEIALSGREAYVRTARMWHLVARGVGA
jgi:S-adenosylmethionine-dependent methyltransferase